MEPATVAALFVREDSVYKGMAGVDCWDAARDARRWPGGSSVVAHPPCALWGRLRRFAKGDAAERELAILAVAYVREFGGVLEHPALSALWRACAMPEPGEFPDECGGYSIEVDQFHFGHLAAKRTWLYIVGVEPENLPKVPHQVGAPTHCVKPARNMPAQFGDARLAYLRKPDRDRTPPAFAEWLVAVARLAATAGTLERG